MEEIFSKATLSVLQEIYTWYVFFPVLLGIVFWRRLTKVQRLVFYISLLSSINNLITFIIKAIDSEMPNVWVYHIFVPILFWLTWRIYKYELKALFSKRAFKVLLVVVLSFIISNSIFIQGLGTTPTYAIFTLSGVFIFWCVSYFFSLLRQTRYGALEREPLFWFNAGVLLYYSSTIVVFLLVFNFLERGSNATYIALILNAFFNIVLVTAYTISLWVKPPQ